MAHGGLVPARRRIVTPCAAGTPGAAACVRLTDGAIQLYTHYIHHYITAATSCVRATSTVLWAPLCGVQSAWRCPATRALPWPLIVCTSPRVLAN